MGWSDKAMRSLEIIMYLVVLNVLWVLGFAMGLGVLGFFPASYALFNMFYNEELFETQNQILPIVKRYISYYLKFFVKANCVGIIYAIFVVIITFNFKVMKKQAMMQALLMIPTLLLLIYVFETAIFFSPVMIAGDGNIRSKIRLIITSPLLLSKASVLNFAFAIISSLIAYFIPVSLILLLVSVTVFLLNKVILQELYGKKILIKTTV